MAKPIKGTSLPENLLGTAGADMLLGKDGNDFITGLAGNDKVDGGKGVDTAIFSGDFDDYTLSFKPQGQNGHGNDDNMVTVTDMVGTDGVDQLKNVEWLKFDDLSYNVAEGNSYIVNGTLDESAQKPSTTDMIVGTGIPATNFGIVRNEAAGIELALHVHHRGDAPSLPYVSSDDYSDGVLHFEVETGPAITGGAPKAEWSFDFSIATGLNGELTDLDDFTFQLLYDVDPGVGATYRTLTLEAEALAPVAPQSGYQWRDADTGLVFISDDHGNANVTQNSENYGFGFFQAFMGGVYGPGDSFAGQAHFDIILQALDGANLIAQNHIVVDVIL
jgi:hypothetical protein